jgi:ureidoglycolate hydrolase
MSIAKVTQQLQIQLITSEKFSPYGQVIFPTHNQKPFDANDAQLILNRGIPRFYIINLHRKEMKFNQINCHLQCTQCLGSVEGKEWLIAVCPPNDIPDFKKISAFRVFGNCFIKLNMGTWHAGPYFEQEFASFYNLELSNTNIIDNLTYSFLDNQNLEFEFITKNNF